MFNIIRLSFAILNRIPITGEMTSKKVHIIRTILIVINIIIILGYLLTSLVPFVNTGKYWFIAFLGLGFPITAFALLIFIIIWAIYRSKWAWISLLAFLIGFKQLNAAFAFHFPKAFAKEKPLKTIRILQYNVAGEETVREARIDNKKVQIAHALNFIKKSNADVLTFQEFYTSFTDKNSIVDIIDSLGYPYHYLSKKAENNKKKYVGLAIFSKFPIVNNATVSYNRAELNQLLIYADIKVDGKIFRIFTTHLESVGINRADYKDTDVDNYGKSTEMKVDKSVAGKLKRAYESRYEQSKIARKQIDESPYPVIFCGDFNDVPNSNTYFTIKGNLQDAFLKKGSFVGKTFRYISPTLRIDYILGDPYFNVTQFRIPGITFSDHFPIIADFQYP